MIEFSLSRFSAHFVRRIFISVLIFDCIPLFCGSVTELWRQMLFGFQFLVSRNTGGVEVGVRRVTASSLTAVAGVAEAPGMAAAGRGMMAP
jgi:hypothetical protein